MRKRRDLTGQKFGRLEVLKMVADLNGRSTAWCYCECGKFSFPQGRNLLNGRTQSCGCLRQERLQAASRAAVITHGHCKYKNPTPEYVAYGAAKYRCSESGCYYKEGIKFLFPSFEEFYKELGPKPSPKHSVDRYPNKYGNYEPGNVRWATQSEQNLNRRPSSEWKKAA